jgi:RNA polymerase subunit RPABC4/transcription elongation factor Spt4
LICQGCKKDIPDDSTFCSSCGRPLKEEGLDIILPPEGSKTEGRATIYLMLSFMCLFFGFFLLIPGYFIGWGLVIPALGMVACGAVFLIARYYIIRRYAKRVEEFRKKSSIRVRCRYCGALNPDAARRCDTCGATL